MVVLYKILGAPSFDRATESGLLPWSGKDREDGFVHLSTAEQVKETAAKHYASETELLLLEIRSEQLEGLRFEPSRGGALFPHVYANIPLSAVRAVHELVGSVPGVFRWPEPLR
jgi:uncharacterized protein (DUF952 family)